MNALVVAPVLAPLACLVASLLAWRSARVQRALALAGPAAILAAGLALLVRVRRDGILVSQLGDWPAPLGISFVADHLASILVVLTGLVSLATVVFAKRGRPERPAAALPALARAARGRLRRLPDRRPLQPLRLVRGDADRLASCCSRSAASARSCDGGVKYVTLNLLSSVAAS